MNASTTAHSATALDTKTQTADITPKVSRSSLVSQNIIVSRHRTSVRLEPEMWDGLRELCRRERATIHQICTSISLQKKDDSSLTAAIRVYVMRYYRQAATEEGHNKAGHGYGLTLGLGAGRTSHSFPAKNMMMPSQVRF
jgi:predicted DNA-binding ribbon-helix-helix protein